MKEDSVLRHGSCLELAPRRTLVNFSEPLPISEPSPMGSLVSSSLDMLYSAHFVLYKAFPQPLGP